jgi:hypothetical protein
MHELEAQSTLIRERVERYNSASPVSIIEAINQLKKGVEVVILSAELMRDRIASLEKANEAASKRKERKKKGVQRDRVLKKGDGENILARKEAEQQIARERRQSREQSGLSCRALARCKRCREPEHVGPK